MAAVPGSTGQQNPFGSSAPHASNAVAAASQQRELAEVQGAIAIAKRFPRDERAAMDRILMACTRPGLADSATYTYSRGGSDVTGPSIRLAEAIAQAWGNLAFGIREVEQRAGESTVEAFAWDMEHNTRQVKVFQVPHERHTKSGVKKLTDPRDIYELVANQGARRVRACILGVIPGDVIEAAVAQAEVTLKTRAEVTPERIAKLLDSFRGYGVTKAHIEGRIQRSIDAMTPAQLVQLGKVFNSLRDGMSKPADWFDVGPEQSAAVSSVNDAVRQRQSARPALTDESLPDAPPASYAQVVDRIVKAQSVDQLEEAGTLISALPAEQQQDATNEYGRRLKQLRTA